MQNNILCNYLKDIIKSIIEKQHFNFDHVYNNEECLKYIFEQLDELKQLLKLPFNNVYKLYTDNQSELSNDVYVDTQYLDILKQTLINYEQFIEQESLYDLYNYIIDNMEFVK